MAEQKHTQDPLDMEEALSTSEAFLIKYKGKILGTIAAVVIIIAGFMGYKHFISEPNEMKASEALFKGEQYFGADNFETVFWELSVTATLRWGNWTKLPELC